MTRAKKSLGQNFLHAKGALSAIVGAGDVHADDIILEIGPGKGALTEKLLILAGKVIAIEKDRELIPLLSEKFEEYIESGRFDLIEGDITEFDPGILAAYGKPYKLIANIPYYITGLIIRMFLETTYQPELMVLLVQKEVADRILARDGKESLLSLSVKAYGTPRFIRKVPKASFHPIPKVDSAILCIDNITKQKFHDTSEEEFFTVLHAGFAHKRKMLAGNLKELGFDQKTILEMFHEAGIPETVRPENVSLEKWFTLSILIHRKRA